MLESSWPYHGKDGLTVYEALQLMPEAWKQTYYQYELADLSPAEVDRLLREAECTTVDEYLEAVFHNAHTKVGPTAHNYYSYVDDWTIPEKDAEGRSVRNQSAGFLVKDVNAMPAPCQIDPLTGKPKLNEVTMSAVKQELRRGHGVAISYVAASPASQGERPTYMRDRTYAQYTWKEDPANHTVCVVGWDDDYPVSNFNQGTVTEQTDKGPVTYDAAPPGPGAWIVKNSWGRKGGTEVKRGGPWAMTSRMS